jgi:hypothetical protein
VSLMNAPSLSRSVPFPQTTAPQGSGQCEAPGCTKVLRLRPREESARKGGEEAWFSRDQVQHVVHGVVVKYVISIKHPRLGGRRKGELVELPIVQQVFAGALSNPSFLSQRSKMHNKGPTTARATPG